MLSDPIADYLTRVRNAQKAGHSIVSIPSSRTKKEITKVLLDNGYIRDYKFEEGTSSKSVIKIALKYNPQSKEVGISKIRRVSSPGNRKYASCKELPRVLNGLGIAIISTSQGVMSDKEARKLNVGGEVLCFVE